MNAVAGFGPGACLRALGDINRLPLPRQLTLPGQLTLPRQWVSLRFTVRPERRFVGLCLLLLRNRRAQRLLLFRHKIRRRFVIDMLVVAVGRAHEHNQRRPEHHHQHRSAEVQTPRVSILRSDDESAEAHERPCNRRDLQRNACPPELPTPGAYPSRGRGDAGRRGSRCLRLGSCVLPGTRSRRFGFLGFGRLRLR